MLDFREFKSEFVSACRSNIASFTECFGCGDIEIEERSVTKAQRGPLSGLIFRTSDTVAAPTYYVEDFYRMYRDGASISELSFDIAQNAFHYIHEDPPLSFEESAKSFEDAANLRIRLINSSRNAELLSTVPNRETGCGLSLIPEVRSGPYRAVVTKELMKSFGISEHDLMLIALANTAAFDVPVLADLTEMLCVGQDDCENLLLKGLSTEPLPAPDSLYVLTNDKFFWGASVLLYPGMTSRLSALLGGDFYVLPSSVHEVLLLPVSMGDPDKLLETIHEGNRTVVNEEDFLSDDLIICEDGDLKIFTPSGPYSTFDDFLW